MYFVSDLVYCWSSFYYVSIPYVLFDAAAIVLIYFLKESMFVL